MLATSPVIAFIATEDSARAKTFYGDVLGFPLVSEDQFACVFKLAGTTLRVVGVKQRTPAPYTVLGWEVADIGLIVQLLTEAGVKFEMFPGLEQTPGGIWNAPEGTKVAWFKDPDSNLLSISQHAPSQQAPS